MSAPTETLFEPATHCWCGARGEQDSPFSGAYFVCGRCGTHFSKQRLRSPEAAREFYGLASYWQARQEQKGHPALSARPEILRASGRVDKWMEVLGRHARPATADALAVEAGCAEGVFLEALAAAGWRCLGVEPDAATARFTAERTGLEVRAGAFPDLTPPLPMGGVDLFAACDVLEHAPDPVRFLAGVAAALGAGGTLFLQLPMVEWDERPFGWIEPGVFDAQEHAFIFSRGALQTLLELVGFDVLENADAWIRGHELVVARRRADGSPGASPADPGIVARPPEVTAAALATVRAACSGGSFGAEVHLPSGAGPFLAGGVAAGGAPGQLLPGLEGRAADSLDFVFSSGWLVGVESWREILAGWRERLRPGAGVLALHLPHPSGNGNWRRGAEGVGETLRWVPDPGTVVDALRTLGFAVASADWRPDAAGAFLVIARREEESQISNFKFQISPPAWPEETPRPRVRLANLGEAFRGDFVDFMGAMNRFAAPLGLQTFTNYSKVWEYPWLWANGLRAVPWPGARLMDLGSELSPVPWWLAARGARVRLVEVSDRWAEHWAWVRQKLGVQVEWSVVAQGDPLPAEDNSLDVLTSFSVLEHQAEPARALDEAARVLAPGGLLALSFDVCEPDLGMEFPAWNGRALTLAEFERVAWRHPDFDPGTAPLWNRADMAEFLRWHLQSAAHHRYVTAAAVLWKHRLE